MKHLLLLENQKKRLELPLWIMLCFAMFCAWQMGFIYFMGSSLTLNGRRPLPIDMDNVTVLIAVGYVLSIVFMMALPHLMETAVHLAEAVANALHHHQREAVEERLAQLTAREREVLNLIGYGYSNRDIAKLLVISEHTVNDYTKKIYRKRDVHSRHAAAQIINRYGLKHPAAEKR